jgi:hypothetical protein
MALLVQLAAVCSQCSQGSTLQPQQGTTTVDLVMTPSDCFAEAFAADLAGPLEGSLAATMSGIQRMNGVRSATSVMYQSFLAGSHLAPSAFTASFSAKGVTRLILMGGLSIPDTKQNAHRNGQVPDVSYAGVTQP